MTEAEMRDMTMEIGSLMESYAKAGKIAGFKMVVAIWHSPDEVTPFVCGAHASDDVQVLLNNPDFAAAADRVPAVYPGRN